MIRFYYDDPISAAYMAKNHGMQLVEFWMFDRSPYAAEISFTGKVFIERGSDNSHIKFYLMPDDIKLLEPQAGDLVEYWFEHQPDYWANGNNKKLRRQMEIKKEGHLLSMKARKPFKIIVIQRNGKAFIMPEEEEC